MWEVGEEIWCKSTAREPNTKLDDCGIDNHKWYKLVLESQPSIVT